MGSSSWSARPSPPTTIVYQFLVFEERDMIDIAQSLSVYNIHGPLPGKRKREDEEEEKEKRDIFDHRVPTMVERKEEVNNGLPHLPFSSMMRRMAAKYQRPASPLPSHLNLPLLSAPLHSQDNPPTKEDEEGGGGETDRSQPH